jgi:hypothetical protein
MPELHEPGPPSRARLLSRLLLCISANQLLSRRRDAALCKLIKALEANRFHGKSGVFKWRSTVEDSQ